MCEFHDCNCNGLGHIWWTDKCMYFSSIDYVNGHISKKKINTARPYTIRLNYCINTKQSVSLTCWKCRHVLYPSIATPAANGEFYANTVTLLAAAVNKLHQIAAINRSEVTTMFSARPKWDTSRSDAFTDTVSCRAIRNVKRPAPQ